MGIQGDPLWPWYKMFGLFQTLALRRKGEKQVICIWQLPRKTPSFAHPRFWHIGEWHRHPGVLLLRLFLNSQLSEKNSTFNFCHQNETSSFCNMCLPFKQLNSSLLMSLFIKRKTSMLINLVTMWTWNCYYHMKRMILTVPLPTLLISAWSTVFVIYGRDY